VKRGWFADHWTQQSYKAQRWRLGVAVTSAIHTFRGTTTACVWQAVQTSFGVDSTNSTTETLAVSFDRDSAWLETTTLHTWHVTSASGQHNTLTPVSISVLNEETVGQVYWTQPALSLLFSASILLTYIGLWWYEKSNVEYLDDDRQPLR